MIKEKNDNQNPLNKGKSDGRDSSGRFKIGHKGGGRILGSKNKTKLIIEKIGLDSVEAVYKRWIELALSGDGMACKGILDRVCPVRKGYNVDLEFDSNLIKTIQDVNKLSEHITSMVITGELSAEEAEDYGKWLERRTKVITDSEAMDKLNTMYQNIDEIKNKG